MTQNAAPNPIRILLVDDHQSFSDGLRMLIDTNKTVMQVIGTASDRTEAINVAAANKPDIILLDLDLGNDSGLEILPELLEKTSAKVIILTGILDPSIHESAIIGGARGVLLKTDSAQVILKAIEKVYNGEIWVSNETLSKVLNRLSPQKGVHDKNPENPEAQKIASLTAREQEIIRAFVNKDSSTNKEIADSLFISDSTLKNHLTTIYSKLGVRNRIELFKYALTHKLDRQKK